MKQWNTFKLDSSLDLVLFLLVQMDKHCRSSFSRRVESLSRDWGRGDCAQFPRTK